MCQPGGSEKGAWGVERDAEGARGGAPTSACDLLGTSFRPPKLAPRRSASASSFSHSCFPLCPAFLRLFLDNGSEGERLPLAVRLAEGKVLATFLAPPPREGESLEIGGGPCCWWSAVRFRRLP